MRATIAIAIGAIVLGVVILAIGCSSSSSTKPNPSPAPDRIQDLRAESMGSAGVLLKWSAPHAGSVAAARYDIRLARVAIADSSWATADTVQGEPVPGSPGSADSFLVGGLDGATTYHFAIRSQDAEAHLSPISNDVSVDVAYGTPKTITTFLSNFRRTWTTFDYDEYARLFDPAFTFIFALQDVGGPYHIPLSWGRADELLCARHFFDHEPNVYGYVADSLSLSFVAGPEIPNDYMENWTKVVLSQVFLTVYSHNQDNGDPLDYIVQGDQANLWFAQIGDLWYLIRWEDKPVGGVAGLVQHGTWGLIKGDWK